MTIDSEEDEKKVAVTEEVKEVKDEEKIEIDAINSRVSSESGELVIVEDNKHQEIGSFNKFLTTVHEEHFYESSSDDNVIIHKKTEMLRISGMDFQVTSLKYQMKKYFFT